MKTPTKTTLVKEKIAEILYDNFYGLGLSKQIETATQALEALVNDECIKVRIKELGLITKRLEANSWGHFDPISIPTDRIAQLRATESPRKKGGVKDD